MTSRPAWIKQPVPALTTRSASVARHEYEQAFHAGVDLSVPATVKPAPILDGVKHTTLDTVEDRRTVKTAGTTRKRPEGDPPVIDESQ